MSDALGAALTLLVVAAVAVASRAGARERLRTFLLAWCGALVGYGVLVRLSAVGLLGSLLVTARPRRLVSVAVLAALPFLTFLAVYQWTEFGSPLRTGYDYYLPGLVEFSPSYVFQESPRGERKFIFPDKLNGALMRWTCPCDEYGPMGKASNAVFYPAVLLGAYWVFYPPLFSLLGVWEIVRRRSSPVGQLALFAVVTNVGMFLAYFYQGGRLVAPAASVLLAFSAVGAARLLALGFATLESRRGAARGQERRLSRSPAAEYRTMQ